MKKILPISFICLLIDQITKFIISNTFKIFEGIKIIPNFFGLIYVQNKGAAWNILDGNLLILIAISILSLFAIYKFLIKDKDISRIETITYGILIGGIFGNLFDRLIRGYVVDFLQFTFWGYNFPIFNFADICIVVSVIFLLIMSLRSDKNADNKI